MPLTCEVDPVAKKKTKGRPKGAGRKGIVATMRGSDAFKDWLERLADKKGDTLAKLLENGVREIAKQINFEDPPRR
jgi:hypothetical protein